MKKTFFAFTLLCFGLTNPKNEPPQSLNMIVFRYGGEIFDTDLPNIVFSNHGEKELEPQFKDFYDYGKSIFCKVDKSDMNSIKKSIETSKFAFKIDTLQISYYYIHLFFDNKKSAFRVNNKKIDSLFNDLLISISNKSAKKNAAKIFDGLLTELDAKKKEHF